MSNENRDFADAVQLSHFQRKRWKKAWITLKSLLKKVKKRKIILSWNVKILLQQKYTWNWKQSTII